MLDARTNGKCSKFVLVLYGFYQGNNMDEADRVYETHV